MTNNNDRLERIEAAIERTQQQIYEGFQKTQQQIEGLSQQIDSNAKAIEALSAESATQRADITATRASVDGLVRTIAELVAMTVASNFGMQRREKQLIQLDSIQPE